VARPGWRGASAKETRGKTAPPEFSRNNETARSVSPSAAQAAASCHPAQAGGLGIISNLPLSHELLHADRQRQQTRNARNRNASLGGGPCFRPPPAAAEVQRVGELGRERPYGDSPGVAQGRSYRPGLLFFRCAPSAFAEASADGRHAETLKVLKDWVARGEQKAR
jgi:hypothetical protein